jgi:XRE family transcriptional regulator, regulator of sulfur utilization
MSMRPNNMRTDFAKAFRVIRAAQGWQQADMARKLGISASQLSLIEAGKRQPSLRVVEDLAEAVQIPTPLVMLLGSDEENLANQDMSALGGALLRLLVSTRDKQRVLPLHKD